MILLKNEERERVISLGYPVGAVMQRAMFAQTAFGLCCPCFSFCGLSMKAGQRRHFIRSKFSVESAHRIRILSNTLLNLFK